MYSHKRSFTGQSTRSIAALLDAPFLISGIVIAGLFSIVHSAITFFKLHDHIRRWPLALKQIPTETLTETLRKDADIFDSQLILTTWLGLVLPFLVFAIINRWSLASLRISVQRSVTLGLLFVFYFSSYMAVALMDPAWTPGNFLVKIFAPLGHTSFQSLRAILCMFLTAAAVMTLTKNATSRLNRNVRIFSASIFAFLVITSDYLLSQKQRQVHPSFLKTQASVRLIYIIPGLRDIDLQQTMEAEQLSELRSQFTSFHKIHPSSPSQLGQLVTSLLGVEPFAHGVRSDFTAPETMSSLWATIKDKIKPKEHKLYVMSVGGPSPLAALVDPSTPGQRCGQTPRDLASLGHFQASVIPHALTPKYLENILTPQLNCSSRFLSVEQQISQTFEKITNELHSPGQKTFLVWFTPEQKMPTANNSNVPEDYKDWDASTKYAFELLMNHQNFLSATKLARVHQTFLIGISTQLKSPTAIAQFDGKSKSKPEDSMFEQPTLQNQSATASLLQNKIISEKENPRFLYSEFTDETSKKTIDSLQPEIRKTLTIEKLKETTFAVNADALRKAIVNSQRHFICTNVMADPIQEMSIQVTLNLHPADNRSPILSFEQTPPSISETQPGHSAIQECLKTAREYLAQSITRDVSLRDSASFRTLLTGLPVKSIQTNATTFEMTNELENEELDRSTSAVPDVPEEEQE